MKKTIFTQFLCVGLLAASFTSCKKESNSPNSNAVEFKAKFNGTEKVFSKTVTASKTNFGASHSLILTGFSETETINISLWSEADDFNAGKTFTFDAEGGPYNGLAYGLTGSISGSYFSYYAYGLVTYKFDCAITESNSTGVKGTFSGYIYKDQTGTIERIDVTDGTFYAKF